MIYLQKNVLRFIYYGNDTIEWFIFNDSTDLQQPLDLQLRQAGQQVIPLLHARLRSPRLCQRKQ